MLMGRAEFRALVDAETQSAERNPVAFSQHVIRLAIVGYAYLLGVLALLLIATIGIPLLLRQAHFGGGIHIAIALLILDFAILRSLWVSLEPPTGLVITVNDAPELFEEIDRIRVAIGVPRLRAVVLTTEFNAAVVQHPTMGIFGGYQNYLVLGVPLLSALSLTECRALLAHEFGHLSNQHGRFGAWIYRARGSWGQLMAGLTATDHWGAWLFKRFATHFLPRFDAASFVLARQHEYEADAIAARIAGRDAVAHGLLRLEILSRLRTSGFLEPLQKRAQLGEPLPDGFVRPLMKVLTDGATLEQAAKWRERAMLRPTDLVDTHPAIADRLRALGVLAADIPNESVRCAVTPSAAETLITARHEWIADQIDSAWKLESASGWASAAEEHRKSIERLRELTTEFENRELSDAEQWEVLEARADVHGDASLRDDLERYLANHPQHLGALVRVARLQLEAEEPAGLQTLDQAIAASPAWTYHLSTIAALWLLERGRTAESDQYYSNSMAGQALLDKLRKELCELPRDAEFAEHGLRPRAVEELCRCLAGLPRIRRVWLVRRVLRAAPGLNTYVLHIETNDWNPMMRGERDRALLAQASSITGLPEEVLVIVENGHTRRHRGRIEAAAGRPIYERS